MDLSTRTKQDCNQEDGNNHRGIGFASGVLPAKETSLQTDSQQGVSTHCVPPASHSPRSMYIRTSHWFMFSQSQFCLGLNVRRYGFVNTNQTRLQPRRW